MKFPVDGSGKLPSHRTPDLGAAEALANGRGFFHLPCKALKGLPG